MMKDEQLARVVRGSRYTLNAITAERDELSDKLENALADLRDERSRVRVLSAQVMSDTEQLESVTSGYRALNTENADNAKHIGALRDRVRALSAQVSDLQEENALTASELADSEHRENIATADLKRAREIGENLNNIHREQVARIGELTAERDNLREISQARALNAEKLRAEVRELTERVEVLQESRADWRTAYDKLRNGQNNYTASASTAFALGTLERAYEVDGETRYPLA
jgi:chromosome segregation ATPase